MEHTQLLGSGIRERFWYNFDHKETKLLLVHTGHKHLLLNINRCFLHTRTRLDIYILQSKSFSRHVFLKMIRCNFYGNAKTLSTKTKEKKLRNKPTSYKCRTLNH